MQPIFKALMPKLKKRKNTKTIGCTNIMCVGKVQSHHNL